MPFYAAFDGTSVIGFFALRVHTLFASEIFVMGLLPEYHRRGIGKRLLQNCEHYCREENMHFSTVKTLDMSRESDSYQKNRLFYQALGFKPLEIFPLLWDADNPCLFMAKYIAM